MTAAPYPSLISLERAREIVRAIPPLPRENVALTDAVGRVTAVAVQAQSACPSTDVSLKDGYAVIAENIRLASPASPVELALRGTVTAGQGAVRTSVVAGSAVRIMSGAAIPRGADAVLASEFAEEQPGRVVALRDAHPGRNILRHGADVRAGEPLIQAGTRLTPTHLGLLAAAGVALVPVHRRPAVMIIATGSELVAPGQAIAPGKVAASNMVTLQAELRLAGIAADTVILRDDLDQLQRQLQPLLEQYDAVLTCGGVLDGDKDLTLRAMDGLGVEAVFRRVRIGPGKGVCLGRRGTTLIFNLPGGPPSNHIAFVLLALPGLLRLTGVNNPFANREQALVTADLPGQLGWTQLIYGTMQPTWPRSVRPLTAVSRLRAMAEADCLIELPEDVGELQQENMGSVWKIR